MNYIGLDLQKRYSVLCAQDEPGHKLKEARIEGGGEGLAQFFHELEGPSKAVIGSVLELGFDPRSAGRD
jgi:hypothetical protein